MKFQARDRYVDTELIVQKPSSLSTPQIIDSSVRTTNAQSVEPISISIAVLSLIVSIVVAYLSNFKRADIKLSFGRNIILFPTYIAVKTGSANLVGVGFNLPITFHNWSPQGGTIQRIRLVLGRQNQDDFYDMTWTTFVRIGSAGNFEDENLAQPIPVGGRSSVNKVVRFDWSPEVGGNQLDLQVSNYELRIYGWTKDSEKPDLEYNTSFAFRDEHHHKFKDNVAAHLTGSIWIPLDENEKPNQLVSRNTISRLYSKK